MATDQKLKWILTEYGKNRITELLSNPEDKVRISIMNIGSDNTGTPQEREGDEPASGNGRLKHQVNPRGIPIFEKGVSSERENTIYFKAMIDENMCGYDISELAIYEERGGMERMFAVGVGQPIAKPDLQYGYLMSIEYTLYIESTNLLDVYDRIELDPNNEFLKESDIDSLYRTILYVEGNLAEQIGRNTHILGLGRAQDLNQLITNTQLKYNAAAISTYYSSMANSVEHLSNIVGFWSFHYTDNYGITNNIKDFSSYANSLSTDVLLSSYPQEYLGVLSSLNFRDNNYFTLPVVPSVLVYTQDIEVGRLKSHEWVGEMLYAPDYNGWSYGGTIYTEDYIKNNVVQYYLKADDANVSSATIQLEREPEFLDDEQTQPNPYAGIPLFGTSCFAPHTWTYNGLTEKWVNEKDDAYDVLEFLDKVVKYTGEPENGDTIETSLNVTADTTSTSIVLGQPMAGVETGIIWTYNSTDVLWSNSDGESLTPEEFQMRIVPYTGDPVDGNSISILTKTPNRNEAINFTGKQFDLVRYESQERDGQTYSKVYDSPFTFIASLQHNDMTKAATLMAQSNYFTEKHNFEIVKTEDNAIMIKLFSISDSQYVEFKTSSHIVPSTVYNLVISYNPKYGSFGMDPTVRVYINNQVFDTTRIINNYQGMKENYMETTSYIARLVDGKNAKTDCINAKICMMALIREEFDAYVARCNSLILNSLAGKNVYYKV